MLPTDVKRVTVHMEYRIVPIQAENLAAAAQVHARSWVESHRTVCTAEFLAQHTPERQRDFLRAELSKGKQGYLLIAQEPVGVVTVDGSLIENLYILPEQQRRGYGSILLDFAIKQCTAAPTLWLLDTNHGAYALYTRHGFRRTGNVHRLTAALTEFEMRQE